MLILIFGERTKWNLSKNQMGKSRNEVTKTLASRCDANFPRLFYPQTSRKSPKLKWAHEAELLKCLQHDKITSTSLKSMFEVLQEIAIVRLTWLSLCQAHKRHFMFFFLFLVCQWFYFALSFHQPQILFLICSKHLQVICFEHEVLCLFASVVFCFPDLNFKLYICHSNHSLQVKHLLT